MMLGRIRREAAEDDAREAARRMRDLRRHGADGDARRALRRIAIDAGRDGGKRDRAQALRGRERERRAITGRQQIVLALVSAAPHRADRVDDVLGFEAIAARDLGGAGIAAAERAAFGEQVRPGGAMDGAVDAAAAEQRPVGGVDDGPHIERGDVRNADLEPRRSDFGGEEGSAHGADGSAIARTAQRHRLRGYWRSSTNSGSTLAGKSIVLRRPMSSKWASRKRRVARCPSLRSVSKYS